VDVRKKREKTVLRFVKFVKTVMNIC